MIFAVCKFFLSSTVAGGLVNGAGLETSSHIYGLFADACLEYEVVLSDGSCRTCSKVHYLKIKFAHWIFAFVFTSIKSFF